jgi:hypothetical protein
MLSVSTAQLAIWPDHVRGALNALLRSALFAGIHSKKRKYVTGDGGNRISPAGNITM